MSGVNLKLTGSEAFHSGDVSGLSKRAKCWLTICMGSFPRLYI